MSLLRRSNPTAHVEAPPAAEPAPVYVVPAADVARLRDEIDPDPLIEEAAERLRAALTSLEAHDEWGRTLAWRQVARIALGPIVTQLRDSQTAARLIDATRAATHSPPAAEDVILFAGPEPIVLPSEPADEDTAAGALPTLEGMPFWPA